jgi:beta-lactamase class A
MRYAASLPKIAIMLGVFDRVAAGELSYTPQLRRKLERMIRRSDNRASSELIELIGFEAIATALSDPRYQLYDEGRNGGLWVGKDYGGPLGYWHRDPLHDISHGATTRQVARFFVMLDRGELISPWASAEMKRVMGKPAIEHKFVRGLLALPRLLMFRKSGTWRNYHADAALVEHDGHRYVAVALVENAAGDSVLTRLIQRLDPIAAPNRVARSER